MKIKMSEIIDYCFNDLPDEQKKCIEIKIFSDESFLAIVRAINRAKRQLGSKEEVLKHFFEEVQ